MVCSRSEDRAGRSAVARARTQSEADGARRKGCLLALVFGVVYWAAVVVGGAFAAGSTFGDGLFFGMFLGTFFFLISYPVILLLQRGIVFLARRLARSAERGPTVWGYAPVLAFSLFLLVAGAIPRSPESYFRARVADTVPPSVSDIRYWYARGMGCGSWAVSFRIAPEDFDSVLARHPYKEKRLDEFTRPWLPEGIGGDPEEPLAFAYEYSEGRPRDGNSIHVNVYANERRDLVYVVGGYD